MKYIIIALLLIGTVKGQDSTLIGSGGLTTGQFSFKVDSSIPRISFSAELAVYDSMKLIGYQKKDSTLVIIGDSARFIRVLLESMSYYSQFKLRYPKRDTVKWKPLYVKKKKKRHADNYIPTYIDLPDGDLIVTDSNVRLGGPITRNVTITGQGIIPVAKPPYPYAVPVVNTVTINEPYPWYKKLFWVMAGAIGITIFVFLYVLFTEPKNIQL